MSASRRTTRGAGVRPALEPERLARAGLLRVAAPNGEAARIAALQGAEEAWAWVCAQAAAKALDVPDPAAEFAAAGGARLVIPGDAEWPPALDALATATPATGGAGVPFGLWVRGALPLDVGCERAVAIVGARASTAYGNWVAGELAAGLAERDMSVVSGAAFGIDGAAHRGALAADGCTVAVLAGGIDVAYPRAHESLLDRIAATGAIVAEAPPGRAPRREAFLVRNRLIAALSSGVVLVEAGLRSGARNTAAHAAALGRPRMAVPGPITSGMSAGCHALLRADPEARLVTSAAEVLEEVGRIGADLAPPGAGPVDVRDGLDDAARAVLEAMPARATVSAGGLAAELGWSMTAVLATAHRLVENDLLTLSADGYRLTSRARAPVRR
jgi:DNA processing protein